MKVTFTGKPEALTPAQRKKVEVKFAKLSRLLDTRKGEREAHVILTQERHLNRAEITVRFADHALVGIGSNTELFPAINAAVEKLEKQVLNLRAKRRDTKRGAKNESWEQPATVGVEEPEEEEAIEAGTASRARVFRVDSHQRRKPMTLDEALLEIERGRDYVVYRDAETDRVSVLVRRRDGHLDLIEA